MWGQGLQVVTDGFYDSFSAVSLQPWRPLKSSFLALTKDHGLGTLRDFWIQHRLWTSTLDLSFLFYFVSFFFFFWWRDYKGVQNIPGRTRK